jgi:hypothetical protein
MKTISVEDLKMHFSEVLKFEAAAGQIANTYGMEKEIKVLLVLNKIKKAKRKPGILAEKASCVFIGGHNTTPDEFFGL